MPQADPHPDRNWLKILRYLSTDPIEKAKKRSLRQNPDKILDRIICLSRVRMKVCGTGRRGGTGIGKKKKEVDFRCRLGWENDF